MRKVIVGKIAAGKDGIDERKTRGGTIAHRDRDGAVQFDHRRRIDAEQHVVEPGDLAPVGGIGSRRIGMHRGNRRLQRVRTEAARRERSRDQRRAFRDLIAVPIASGPDH